MNILVVEDELSLCEVLVTLLRQNNYSCDSANDGITGEECAESGIYDAIILDIMLPRKNGLEVLRSLRRKKIATPVLLLTAKSEVEDKISGLDYGADDYLTKPFVSGELMARLRAITRRKGEVTGDELSCNRTVLNRNTHTLGCRGNAVKLGGKEYQIMELLMQNSRQIIPKERFIEKIWVYEAGAEYNAIEVYISFIRKKLTAIQADIQIKATRGVGYSLEDNP